MLGGDINMFYKLGHPAGSVVNRYEILQSTRRSGLNFALVRRTRRNQGLVTVVYVVVRSPMPILANGTILNALEATTGGKRFRHKMRDSRTWMSNLADAEAAFRSACRRGKPGRTQQPGGSS